MACSYQSALGLKQWYENLNLGVGLPEVVMGIEFTPVKTDKGEQDYFIKMGEHTVNVSGMLSQLMLTPEIALRVKKMAAEVGVQDWDVEQILSDFTDMKKMRNQLFEQWLTMGRPDTHIFRS